MPKPTKKNPVGRPEVEDKTVSRTVSIKLSREKEIKKEYETLTKAIDYIPKKKPRSPKKPN